MLRSYLTLLCAVFFTTAIFAQHTFVYENFDANNGGWASSTAAGRNGSWSYTSANTPIVAEAGYWVLNSFNNYGSNYYTYLTSPAYSTLGYTGVTLKLDIFHDTDSDTDDGMQVQYSFNGAAWFTLGSTTSTGTNWYNDTDIDGIINGADGWSGLNLQNGNSASKFMQASITDAVLDNRATIYFRVLFASDGSTSDDGVAIDNFFLEGTSLVPSIITTAPGGRTNDLKLWLKANDGVTTTNNTNIATWTDQAFDNNAIAYGSFLPTFKDNATDNINYNPIIEFDRTANEHMKGKGGFHSQDYFIVFSADDPIDNSSTYRQQLIAGKFSTDGFAVDGTGIGLGRISARYTDAVIAHTKSSFPQTGPPNATSYGRAYASSSSADHFAAQKIMLLNIKTNSGDTAAEIYLNGEQIDNQTGLAGDGNPLNFSEFNNLMYYLGVGTFTMNGNIAAYFDGRMSEMISYSSKGSTTEQDRVLSYLAIKNGITLKAGTTTTSSDREGDRSYVASDGTTIWDHTSDSGAYNYDIAGIGRDDDSGLNQKQSRTQNDEDDVTISLGGIYTTNNANPNTFANDKDYLVWGNNGDKIVISSPTINKVDLNGTTTDYIMADRKWRIQETTSGDIGDVFISIPSSFLQTMYTLGADEEYALIVADDGAFGSGDIVDILPFDVNGSQLEIWYDFDDTRYFTVGIAQRAQGSYGLDFGSGDYIVSNNDINLNSDFTIATWVKKAGGAGGTIFAKDGDYEISVGNSGTIDVDWNGATRLSGSRGINGNNWHHIAVVKSGTTASLYVDGILDTSATVTNPIANSSNFFSVGVVWTDKNNISTAFNGDIDELLIWDTALSLDQIRYMMNQEIEEISNNAEGKIVPTTITKNEISGELWSSLQVYYDFNNYYGTSVQDKSDNQHWARIKYLSPDKRVVAAQTAPLPYVTTANGSWTTPGTWVNGSDQLTPGSVVMGTPMEWNIVQVQHNVSMPNSAKVLALMNTAGTLSVAGGNALTVSHYLELDGKIDLQGEAQLIQETDSDLEVTSAGTLERDQQGTLDRFTYNYWSSPVGAPNTSTNNNSYQLQNILMDGSNASSPVAINWTNSLNGSTGTPITLSNRWIYRFANGGAGQYTQWIYTQSTGTISAGEGFTMKGPGVGISSQQNYVFEGKPNNGDITLTVAASNQYLVGNPYPSAIDAHEFIDDNPGTNGALYFWEHWGGGSHALGNYQGGYGVRTKSGGTPAASHPDVDQSGSGTITPGQYVPVSQGFYIQADGGGTITFENDQRIFVTEGGSSFFIRGEQQTSKDQSVADTRAKIRVGFDSPIGIHRQLLLTIDPTTTNGVDWGYEGPAAETQSEDMFWRINSDNYVIQAIPEIDESLQLDLTVTVEEEGIASFGIDALENFDKSLDIYLLDKVSRERVQINEGTHDITLTPGTYDDRFSLVFVPSQVLGVEEVTLNDLQVAADADNANIMIVNPSGKHEVKSVEVFNILGQKVLAQKLDTHDNLIAIPFQANASGVYIVKVITDQLEISKKISMK